MPSACTGRDLSPDVGRIVRIAFTVLLARIGSRLHSRLLDTILKQRKMPAETCTSSSCSSYIVSFPTIPPPAAEVASSPADRSRHHPGVRPRYILALAPPPSNTSPRIKHSGVDVQVHHFHPVPVVRLASAATHLRLPNLQVRARAEKKLLPLLPLALAIHLHRNRRPKEL